MLFGAPRLKVIPDVFGKLSGVQMTRLSPLKVGLVRKAQDGIQH